MLSNEATLFLSFFSPRDSFALLRLYGDCLFSLFPFHLSPVSDTLGTTQGGNLGPRSPTSALPTSRVPVTFTRHIAIAHVTGCFLTQDAGRASFNDRYTLCAAKTILQPCFSAPPCLFDIHSQLCINTGSPLLLLL